MKTMHGNQVRNKIYIKFIAAHQSKCVQSVNAICAHVFISDYSDSNEIHNIDDSDDEIETVPAQQQYHQRSEQQYQRPPFHSAIKNLQLSSSSSSSSYGATLTDSTKSSKMYVTEYPAKDHSRLRADLDRMRQMRDRHYLKRELLKLGVTRLQRHLAVNRSIKWYVIHLVFSFFFFFFWKKTICARCVIIFLSFD